MSAVHLQSVDALSDAARAAHVTLVGGSIPERSADKLYNTCCVFGPDGKLLAKHRKVRHPPMRVTVSASQLRSEVTAGSSPRSGSRVAFLSGPDLGNTRDTDEY